MNKSINKFKFNFNKFDEYAKTCPKCKKELRVDYNGIKIHNNEIYFIDFNIKYDMTTLKIIDNKCPNYSTSLSKRCCNFSYNFGLHLMDILYIVGYPMESYYDGRLYITRASNGNVRFYIEKEIIEFKYMSFFDKDFNAGHFENKIKTLLILK